MAQITQKEILEACIKGIRKSFFEYYEWSGGEWLDNAPEYLLTVNIAKELAKIKKGKYITLEDNVKEILKSAEAKLKGRHSKGVRISGRSDIILWRANGYPRGIIEVKNAISGFTDIEKDVERIKEILKKSSRLEFGIVTFYISDFSDYGTKYLENKIEKITGQINDYIKKYNYLTILAYQLIISNEKGSAFGVAIMIKRKR